MRPVRCKQLSKKMPRLRGAFHFEFGSCYVPVVAVVEVVLVLVLEVDVMPVDPIVPVIVVSVLIAPVMVVSVLMVLDIAVSPIIVSVVAVVMVVSVAAVSTTVELFCSSLLQAKAKRATTKSAIRVSARDFFIFLLSLKLRKSSGY